MKWKAFKHGGLEYSLDHLHPHIVSYTQPEKDGNPARVYRVLVKYSLHCFAIRAEPEHDPSLRYSDNRETRTFCFDRYQQSFLLPAIMSQLDKGHIYHTAHETFLRVDTELGGKYEVYFNATKTTEDADALLFVQSAYIREVPQTKKHGKIKLWPLLFKVSQGLKPKACSRR